MQAEKLQYILPEPKLAAVDWDLCISVSLKFKSSYVVGKKYTIIYHKWNEYFLEEVIFINGKPKDNILKKSNKQTKNRAKQNKTKTAINLLGFLWTTLVIKVHLTPKFNVTVIRTTRKAKT